jgi:hypothetical protein
MTDLFGTEPDDEVQDNVRERELRALFKLEKPPGEGRGGTDAYLDWKGQRFDFELKSTTRGSVTTVRDFGPEHITKWKTRYWLIGVYNKSKILQSVIFATPQQMLPWIDEKEKYIALDFQLAEHVPELIGHSQLHATVGKKNIYSLSDAKCVMKKQWSKAHYAQMKDVEGGYSPDRMLEILRLRCKYVIRRGSTLNNPHVPSSYFVGFHRITSGHDIELRKLIDSYRRVAATDTATL